MNREIKFRVWEKQTNKMCEWDVVNQWHFFHLLGNRNLFIFLQFTGLKDKNGKEIYEGDILKSKPYLFDGTYVIGQVIFQTERSKWVVEEIDETWKETEILFEVLQPPHETEIIGNIYENPELLT